AQVWPVGQEHASVCPQPSVMPPQSVVWVSGVQVSGAQFVPPPASVWGTQALLTHCWPAPHAGQVMPTPHASRPTVPQWPVHTFGWHVCDGGLVAAATHTLPPTQADPQRKVCPEQGSTQRPQWYVAGHAVAGTQAPSDPASP